MSDTGPLRMLFVDDEPSLVEYIVELFEEDGFEVTAEASGGEALERIKADPGAFDVIITDQTMPVLLGTELARAIRGLNADVPILLCTGFSDQMAEAALEDGSVTEVVQKPVRALELIDRVRNLIG